MTCDFGMVNISSSKRSRQNIGNRLYFIGISWTLQFLNGLQKTAFNAGEETEIRSGSAYQ